MEIDKNEEVEKIINLYNNFKTINYNFDKNINSEKRLEIINLLYNYSIGLKLTYNGYKNDKLFALYEFIVSNIIYIYQNDKDINLENIIFNVINKINVLNKGQNLLYKLDECSKKYFKQVNYFIFLTETAQKGTLLTFMFWYNKFNNLTKEENESVIRLSFINSDDRIYKFLFTKVDKDLIESNINILLSNLASSTSIPVKYKLRRIKVLSNYINLDNYLSLMIKLFSNDLKILSELHKYYYKKPYSFDDLYFIVIGIIDNDYSVFDEMIYNSFKLKKNRESSLIIIIYTILNNGIMILDNNFNKFKIEKIIKDNNKDLMKIINYYDSDNEFYKFITSSVISNINKNINVDEKILFKNKGLLIYTRFYNYTGDDIIIKKNIIKYNLVTHTLRLWSKKIYNKRILNFKMNMYNILNELESKSSLKLQSFNIEKPRYINKNENISNKFIVRDYKEGIFVNKLPSNIYPFIDNYLVKSIYDENDEIYYIYDIDIPNSTLVERYEYLLKLHNKEFKVGDFDKELNEYNNELDKFIKYNKDKVKWYPLFSMIYNDKNIINTHTNIIITKFENNEDVKIVSKENMYVKLLYNNNKFVDDNRNDWNKLIIDNNKNYKNNRIYKFIPINNKLKFSEVCYDDFKPDNYKTILNIFDISI